MKTIISIIALFTCLQSEDLFAQDIPLPENLPDEYLFGQNQKSDPKIITKKGVYLFKNKWSYSDYEKIYPNTFILENLNEFNNQNFNVINDSLSTLIIISGGGHVFSSTKKSIKRLDSSVDQKNQFYSSLFLYNNQSYMYGGYGFWTFKDYITTFDKSTGQWELVSIKSDYVPEGRWKAVSHVMNDKLYVLGGRNSPNESANKDIPLNDFFYFDFLNSKFVNLGETNHLIPTVNSVNSNVIINEKKAYLDNDKIIIFDFIKDTVTSYVSKNIFEGIDLKNPVVNRQDTLYYIKNFNNNKLLARFPISDLNQIQPKTYSISSKKEPPYKSYFAVILAALLCWTSYRLFTFKDHLKGLVLFDERRLYFNQNSSLVTEKQLLLIQHLEKKSFISSSELNTIISSKKYVKSHFTLLRTEFIEEINIILKSVTDNKRNLIEEIKDPLDKRYKVYKINAQISKREPFLSFLFKI